jgi:hypothetical protein
MAETVIQNNFNVSADTTTNTLKITLTRDGCELGFVEIDRSKASALAATILGVAGRTFQLSGAPNPAGREAELTAVVPTGCNVGPGRTSDKLMLMFYFGDTVLGIEVPHDTARILGQRLLTSAAEGCRQ